VSILGNWTNKGPMMTRPKWSDEAGQVQLVAFACRFIIDFVSLFMQTFFAQFLLIHRHVMKFLSSLVKVISTTTLLLTFTLCCCWWSVFNQ